MPTAYRLSSRKYPANTGSGAALRGGRWNPIGIPVIYSADSRALAALEILVHYSVLPRDFAMTQIKFPAELVGRIGRLPVGWQSDLELTQQIGLVWHQERRFVVLCVPSAIEHKEANYIVNPAHPDFHRLQFSKPELYLFDPRLRG